MDAETNPSRDEWAFKALKQVVKIKTRTAADAALSASATSSAEGDAGGDKNLALSSAADALLSSYGAMLSLAQRGGVTAPVAEKKLGSLLDFLATTLGGAGEGAAASSSALSAAVAAASKTGEGSRGRRGTAPPLGERVLERVYLTTLDSLSRSSAAAAAAGTGTAASRATDRLAFRTRLRLAALWLDQRAHERAARLLDELLEEQQQAQQVQAQQLQQQPLDSSKAGETPAASAGAASAAAAGATPTALGGGGGDARAGTATLDVLALQIRLRTERGDAARSLKPLHRAASAAVALAIPHPRVVGVIRECGALVAMADRDWCAAATDFFEAFKSYDEAGSRARGRCLRRCALAAMLLRSGVDPFEAQEARPFRADPAVRGTTELVRAYQAADALEFERVLSDAKEKARVRRLRELEGGLEEAAALAPPSSSSSSQSFEDDSLGGDRLFEAHLGDLRQLLRRAVALGACAPYVRVRLRHLAEKLGVSADEAEATVSGLILDGELEGASIDQVAGTVELGRRGAMAKQKADGGGGGGAARTAAAAAATDAASTAAAAASTGADVTTEVKRSAAVRAWAWRARELQGMVVARMQAA